jgi:hypothetical protein
LHDTFGTNEDQPKSNFQRLASMISTATESCIRLLSDFKKLGLIELSGKKLFTRPFKTKN